MARRSVIVSVIGGRVHSPGTSRLAFRIGQMIAQAGAVLVCGGLKGVMESVAKGASEAGGLTIGLIPGNDRSVANPYIQIALPTSIGEARNAMVASAADVIIALPGSFGTQSEICFGLYYGRPVIDLGKWGIKGMKNVNGLADVEKLLRRFVGKAARTHRPNGGVQPRRNGKLAA